MLHQLILITIGLNAVRGFVAKKQQPKLNIERRPQHVADDDYESMPRDHADDPHGRLGGWIRTTARRHIPIRHPRTRIDVHVSAGLYQIVDLDQKNNLATVSAYFDVWWIDEFLSWEPADFDGISRMFVPLKWLWKPEFYMYHSVTGRVPEYPPDASAEIQSNGRVRMFVSITSKSFCPINFKRFPFDSQTCSFACGSWTYQTDIVNLLIDKEDIDLGDFYDNQEWLLLDASLFNGTTRHIQGSNESFSMVQMQLSLKRQSFYYVFNLVFPTTLVSLVAVIGFHAPINATGRRESKFRLGIMTLLSMSVMLLMLVGEMKFAMESVPGQRGSFSDVPLLGIYYMTLIFIISISTCTTMIFVHLEKFALRNPAFQAIPWYLRWLSGKKFFCCYVPTPFRYDKEIVRNHSIQVTSNHSSDLNITKSLIPSDVNFMEVNRDAPLHGDTSTEAHRQPTQRMDVVIALLREIIQLKDTACKQNQLRPYWDRVIKRLETFSLSFYLLLIAINITLFLYPEVWY